VQKILALCARNSGNDAMYTELISTLAAFPAQENSWKEMVHKAEQHGVASLLHKHVQDIDLQIPKASRRLLQSLYLRNRRSNVSRNGAVVEIINAYRHAGIDVLLVKGIALCNFVYSEIALRPMRDIDLLVKKSDLKNAECILLDLGYSPAQHHSIPHDYYHLAPLEKKIDGLPVGIELHHNLLPFHPQYPLWPLERSYHDAREIKIDGISAHTLSLEDTLHYVYLHGFQAPLTYEPYRLMHVADVVSLVEKYVSEMDWEQIQREKTTLVNRISRFHFLTPWSEPVCEQLGFDIEKKPRGIGSSYNGWPLRKIKDVDRCNAIILLQETLFPSQWWLQLYYGYLYGSGYWKARCFEHPRTIWRWIKVYWYAYLKNRKVTS
jgi:Uncharacterised nucleotidyltransferase